MEILEHGKTYQIRTCPYCKCVFATCQKDFKEQSFWYDGAKNACWESLNCPECGKEIEIKEIE